MQRPLLQLHKYTTSSAFSWSWYSLFSQFSAQITRPVVQRHSLDSYWYEMHKKMINIVGHLSLHASTRSQNSGFRLGLALVWILKTTRGVWKQRGISRPSRATDPVIFPRGKAGVKLNKKVLGKLLSSHERKTLLSAFEITSLFLFYLQTFVL